VLSSDVIKPQADNFSHPNVRCSTGSDTERTDSQTVLLYEAISVPNADALFLVLEYLPGGVLMSIKLGDEAAAPPFGLDQSREYFRQLILGLEYLHANGVIHRDVSLGHGSMGYKLIEQIKPDNILLSEDRTVVKLCDFGVSEMFVVADSDDRIKKSGGSPAFLSPESFTCTSLEGTAAHLHSSQLRS
jgi:[calcium/calmodulin-dependent protein kinase] kinase